MKDLDDVVTAFRALPPRVTRDQIAAATGRTADSVRVNWSSAPGFPPALDDGTRDRDAVLAWYREQAFADPGHRGVPKTYARVGEVRPFAVLLTPGQIAQLLHLADSRGIAYYYSRYVPQSGEMAFPSADERGLRPWPAVREWLLTRRVSLRGEHRPLPLPPGADARWLSAETGLDEDTSRAVLEATTGTRLGRGPLAELLGTTPEKIKYYAKTYGPDSADPFPAPDERRTRSVADTRAWLARNTGKSPAAVLADLADCPRLVTNADLAESARVSARTVREWSKLPGFPPLVRDGHQRGHERDQLLLWLCEHLGKSTEERAALRALLPEHLQDSGTPSAPGTGA
ncbi:hypothetical protein [Kitasatospora sp. NPDC088783]|uniref:hypothetical protein n=1 Tax=Kitasatospora sp. NPDC088783 TaxID=3364077 RepID=UPI0038069957